MADEAALEAAVRRVLPAVNLSPSSFELEPGFLLRARRRSRPSAHALNGLTRLLVFVASTPAGDPDAVVLQAAGEALSALTTATRGACEQLLVAWEDPNGTVFAAAFSVSPEGDVGRLLGSSWLAPESWPDAMIDASKPIEQVIEEALGRVASVVHHSRSGPEFDAMLNRGLRLVDLALEVQHGEGQDVSDRPSASMPDAVWDTWLDRFEHSVRDEWRRIRGGDDLDRIAVGEPTANGHLSGRRIFLSYARPDSTALAYPVYEALRSLGAYVWFDQREPVEKTWLDIGLAEKIRECDTYVMCASDEFVERAGYATQEVAWAVHQVARGVKTQHFLVVARHGTVLPSIVAEWPLIELQRQSRDELAGLLAARLLASVTNPPNFPAPTPERASVQRPTLPRDADITMIRLRVKHLRRFLEIDHESLMAVAGGVIETRRAEDVRVRLLHVNEGLDWDGGLAALEVWPGDSAIRDLRFRIASMRAVAGTRWPLSGSLDEPDDIAPDVAYLSTQRVPVLDWSIVPGWGENERRLALRHHAGLLRALQELLQRGLCDGLMQVQTSDLDAWERELAMRRLECVDALIAMRVQGLLSWKGEPPTWDGLFRLWSTVVRKAADGGWDATIPSDVTLALRGNMDDIAAVAAQVTWQVANYGGDASQSFMLANALAPTSIDVWAAGPEGVRPGRPEAPTRQLQLGLREHAETGAQIDLSWARFTPDSGYEQTWHEASRNTQEGLRQALSFSTH